MNAKERDVVAQFIAQITVDGVDTKKVAESLAKLDQKFLPCFQDYLDLYRQDDDDMEAHNAVMEAEFGEGWEMLRDVKVKARSAEVFRTIRSQEE